jgi:predicted phosphodiesterase
MRITPRVIELAGAAERLGVADAAAAFGLKESYIRRAVRYYKESERLPEPIDEEIKDAVLAKIKGNFSDKELKKLAEGKLADTQHYTPVHNFCGDTVTIGYCTDTHLGSLYTHPEMLSEFFEECDLADVDLICHSGDVHEGLSNRAGHVYECTHVGYNAQLDLSREVFSEWKHTPIYMIAGNHDEWFKKNSGAEIVKELCAGQDNLMYLGHDEGDIKLNGAVTLKLWHGGDGSSYAFSYRVQKVVESFSGGEKPNIMFCGHTHKAISMFCRNIHCVSGGSIQKQSKWMRGKRLSAHVGFHIVKVGINDTGVAWIEPRWYPFYQ